MSIPPLVCSTPPPPDQCDDDKDPDNFGIKYNLSQDDDEYGRNDYDFYEYQFKSNVSESSLKLGTAETVSNVDNLPHFDVVEGHNDSTNKCGVSLSHFKLDEDNNVEDLNLKYDQESINNINIKQCDSSDIVCDAVATVNDVSISENKENLSDMSAKESILKGNEFENCEKVSESIQLNNSNVENIDNVMIISTTSNDYKDLQKNYDSLEFVDIKVPTEIEIYDKQEKENQSDLNNLESKNNLEFVEVSKNIVNQETDVDAIKTLDDKTDQNSDFEDFDDYVVHSSYENTLTVNEDPWQNNIPSEGFGDFQANFENVENSQKDPKLPIAVSNHANLQYQSSEENDYDEFGDFGDFKTSETLHNELEDKQIPVLSLSSDDNENQIIERIEKMVFAIFDKEIVKPDNDIEVALESLLSVTWQQLMNVEIRQPYMVNWNNSTGQKTLLKALCIDSRNILFTPKWIHNMPKYAANLGMSPLQPLKQSSKTSVLQTDSEKLANRSYDTLSDQLAAASTQESCNTSETIAVEKKFDLTPSLKSEKNYPGSLNILPVHQINLPDTHIYTPTDSEIPRSKTIHYDISPILSPNTTAESMAASIKTVDIKENEYSDFQDFKSNPSTYTERDNNDINQIATANTSFHMQTVLQPVKVEQSVTLNWPDPGQIKEIFDDFTDFISNSTWVEDQNNIMSSKSKENQEEVIKEEPMQNEEVNQEAEFNDDFDTFQSAAPSAITNALQGNTEVKIPNNKIDPIPINKGRETVIDVATIPSSFVSNTLINDDSNAVYIEQHSVNKSNNSKHLSLTPIVPATKQPSGQILQPLSLESFSQINWPNPGIDLQDLSRFNPVEAVHSMQGDGKSNSPSHSQVNLATDDDGWGDFISNVAVPAPKTHSPDDDEWSDFVSGVKPHNGLNTISFNVHSSLSVSKFTHQNKKQDMKQTDVPTLEYVTPKANNHKTYSERHFQNL